MLELSIGAMKETNKYLTEREPWKAKDPMVKQVSFFVNPVCS
jgi:hypothetical protein